MPPTAPKAARRAVPLNKLGKLKPRADVARAAQDEDEAEPVAVRKPRAKLAEKPAEKPARKSPPKARAPRTAAGRKPEGKPDGAGYYLLLIFGFIYAAATLVWHVSPLIGLLYGGASLGCFIVYAIDKRAARKSAQRTPEITLLLMGLFCGWPGAVLAQQWLRHKSSKAAFLWPFRLTVLLNMAAFVYLSSPMSFLRHF
jgi:uncharacterized membrane protein YsdA (DUF1294 family)